MVGAGRVGVELKHPARGVDRPGDGSLLGQLTGLAHVYQHHVAGLDLAGDLLDGQVADPRPGLGHQLRGGLGLHAA
jgi:hypothetical protein